MVLEVVEEVVVLNNKGIFVFSLVVKVEENSQISEKTEVENDFELVTNPDPF